MQNEINLRQVQCCATCNHGGGWLENMWCILHDIEIKPYLICQNYNENIVLVELENQAIIAPPARVTNGNGIVE